MEVLSSWARVLEPGKLPDFWLHTFVLWHHSPRIPPSYSNQPKDKLAETHRPTPQGPRTLNDVCVGTIPSDFEQFYMRKRCETWLMIYYPYPRSSERLTICRSHQKGSTFYLVILRPWDLFRPGFEPAVSRSADRRSPNWANRAAVESR